MSDWQPLFTYQTIITAAAGAKVLIQHEDLSTHRTPTSWETRDGRNTRRWAFLGSDGAKRMTYGHYTWIGHDGRYRFTFIRVDHDW